jgi:hypothetical protein
MFPITPTGGTTIGAEFTPLAAWGILKIIDDIAYA